MKIILNKLFLIVLFILNISCESGSNIVDTPPPVISDCIEGQSIGCDDNCSTNPLENDGARFRNPAPSVCIVLVHFLEYLT